MKRKNLRHSGKSCLLGTAQNQKAAASICGLSQGIVTAARDAGCPAFSRRGTVDCDALMEWVATHKDDLSKDKVDYGLEKALKMRVERETKEFQLQVKRGQFVPLDKMLLFMSQLGHDLRTIILRCHLMAPACAGQSVEVIAKLLTEHENEQLGLIKRLDDPLAHVEHGTS